MARLFSVRIFFISVLILLSAHSMAQTSVSNPGFDRKMKEAPNQPSSFAVPYTVENLSALNSEGIRIKYITKNWLYITSTPNEMASLKIKDKITDFHFENYKGEPMADTARLLHYVNPVHSGSNGLSQSFTGKDVIIGYVDQGLDFTHPDFINPDGTTRVLRYWDHTTNSGGPESPYGYGIVWDEAAINAGACTSTETSTGHGTTVAGMGSGNGLANGKNKGIAPESKIIIVESNFGLSNWTLTIADACDYIFKVADTLGLPAVVNLSLGTYLGSHDGNDAASEAIEAMLDEKPGRIVVCAAGNSGAKGKYHVHEDVQSDTSFIWIMNNPNSSAYFGPNKIYFDLWADATDATFQYAFGADTPGPSYSYRGGTAFRPAMNGLETILYDTIYNSLGDRIATIELFPEVVGNNYHLEVLFSNVDSTSYYYRFMTKGSGEFDMWSGAWMGLNDFVTNIPDVSAYPPIADYIMPDTLQTIVSSWNCSEKVISVGNIRNRQGHIDKNNNLYVSSDQTPVGKLSPNSSKGPSRHNVVKPDVSASGDVSLTAGPLWMLNNPGNNSFIDVGGWHVRNGGTSMASPLVAGLAALYLEKCPLATYNDFKNDLISTTYTDNYTGSVPNMAYGYGKPHGLDLMLSTDFTAGINGGNEICTDPVTLLCEANTSLSNVVWNQTESGNPILGDTAGYYIAEAYDLRGCKTVTDTHFVEQIPLPSILPIIQSGNVLATLSSSNYQWTLNGVDIPGATEQTLFIEPPYGVYTCYCINEFGCIAETPPLDLTVGLTEETADGQIFPNPARDLITIDVGSADQQIKFLDAQGKTLYVPRMNENEYYVGNLSPGLYYVVIYSDDLVHVSKMTKL